MCCIATYSLLQFDILIWAITLIRYLYYWYTFNFWYSGQKMKLQYLSWAVSNNINFDKYMSEKHNSIIKNVWTEEFKVYDLIWFVTRFNHMGIPNEINWYVLSGGNSLDMILWKLVSLIGPIIEMSQEMNISNWSLHNYGITRTNFPWKIFLYMSWSWGQHVNFD